MRDLGGRGGEAEQRSGWLTPIKMLFGGVAIFALMAVFAIQRLPGETAAPPAPTVEEARFDAAWADSFQTAVAKRQDRVRQIELVSSDPKPVQTERIMPDAPAAAPPVVVVQEEEQPAARPRHHHRIHTASADTGVNVCTRHKMHKEITRGGKSWRCRK